MRARRLIPRLPVAALVLFALLLSACGQNSHPARLIKSCRPHAARAGARHIQLPDHAGGALQVPELIHKCEAAHRAAIPHVRRLRITPDYPWLFRTG